MANVEQQCGPRHHVATLTCCIKVRMRITLSVWEALKLRIAGKGLRDVLTEGIRSRMHAAMQAESGGEHGQSV